MKKIFLIVACMLLISCADAERIQNSQPSPSPTPTPVVKGVEPSYRGKCPEGMHLQLTAKGTFDQTQQSRCVDDK